MYEGSRYLHGLLEGSVPHPKIIGGVRTPATPPVAEPLAMVIILFSRPLLLFLQYFNKVI